VPIIAKLLRARTLQALALMVLAYLFLSTEASAQRRLEVLAAVGPWPVASNPIIYDGRLWFSVSVKGRNHNSADLWSLDPQTGDLQYERHLFSQDAGTPVIFQGLLYWPHEDSRLSLGYGAISVTDGDTWGELEIPTAKTFHLHHLIDWGGTLVAVTSAWQAGLQTSDDGGATWSAFYDHPTEAKRVSRLNSPAVVLGRLYFKLRDPAGTRLVRVTEHELAEIAQWPQTHFHSLTSFNSTLYGIVGRRGSASIWKSSWKSGGRKSQRLAAAYGRGDPVDLYAGKDRIWALFAQTNGGYVASSKDGNRWQIEATFEGGTPHELIVAPDQILIAGTGADGQAAIWGIKGATLKEASKGYRREIPVPFKLPPSDAIDWQQQSDRLKNALRTPANFRNHGREGLREVVRNMAALSPPPEFFANHLEAAMPDIKVAVIGGEAKIPARRIGQWNLLWAMRSNARARVPPALLARPWELAIRRSEKYFDPLLAALMTVSYNRQNDTETIATLINRLKSEQDPLWLKGDIIGVLTAVTGQKFGYKIDRWLAWWDRQRPD